MVYQYKGMGPSMGTMICGWGNRDPGLFYMESEGNWILEVGFSVGSASVHAYVFMDQGYSYNLEVEQAYNMSYQKLCLLRRLSQPLS